MGALPFLRAGLGQVDHVQLVEPPALHPHIAVRVGRRHRDQIQRHRRGQPVAVLVVGVVAAQLRAAWRGVHPHLPPRAEVKLELFQRRAIPLPLPCQRRRAIQALQHRIPLPCRDLLNELRTGRHADPSLKTVFVGLLCLL